MEWNEQKKGMRGGRKGERECEKERKKQRERERNEKERKKWRNIERDWERPKNMREQEEYFQLFEILDYPHFSFTWIAKNNWIYYISVNIYEIVFAITSMQCRSFN